MPRNKLQACAVALLALAVVLFAITRRPTQPKYQGRELWTWLEAYSNSTNNLQQAHEAIAAVRSIGTNALPFLLKWLRNSDNIPVVINGFDMLGADAAPAIPELERMMNDSADPLMGRRAIVVLSKIREPGFQTLSGALTNPQHPLRGHLLVYTASMAPIIGTNQVLPVLNAASSQDPTFNAEKSRIINRLSAR